MTFNILPLAHVFAHTSEATTGVKSLMLWPPRDHFALHC